MYDFRDRPVRSALETPASTVPIPEPAGTTISSQTVSPVEPHVCTPITITQTDGSQVTLSCRPQRLIVANADAAEMLIAFGAGNRIVGVTDSTLNLSYIMDKIPQAQNIGDWQTPNVEQILALHPDAVISYSSYKPKNLDQLTAANITVISLDCYKLTTLPSDARALGALTGKTNEAEVYARRVEDTIAEVAKRVKEIPTDKYPTVYFESYTDYTASANGSGSRRDAYRVRWEKYCRGYDTLISAGKSRMGDCKAAAVRDEGRLIHEYDAIGRDHSEYERSARLERNPCSTAGSCICNFERYRVQVPVHISVLSIQPRFFTRISSGTCIHGRCSTIMPWGTSLVRTAQR